MKEILGKVDEVQAEINALRPFSDEMNRQIREYFRIGPLMQVTRLKGTL